MTSALRSNIAAPTPDLSGVEFATSVDGMPVSHIDDLVLAMGTSPNGFAFLASAVFVRRPLTELMRADFTGHDSRVADVAEFLVHVGETAGHKRDLAALNRVQTRMSVSTRFAVGNRLCRWCHHSQYGRSRWLSPLFRPQCECPSAAAQGHPLV